MEAVGHHVQDVSKYLHVVAGVEGVGDLAILVDVQQHFFEEIEAQVAVGAELVPERPDDAV